MTKVKLYLPEPLSDFPLAPWFTTPSKGLLFTANLPPNFFETEIEHVADPKDAQAILLSNNFHTLDDRANGYIRTYADLGASVGVPVIVFSAGDATDSLRFDGRVFPLRLSLYRTIMQPNDISIPTTAEIPPAALLTVRAKAAVPTVGFCGKGSFPSLRSWLGYFVKESMLMVKTWRDPSLRARKIGVYWRRAMMNACRSSNLVRSNFIVRKSFSSIRKTIELDPAVARREFLQNIIESDFVLAPKGDGNYSNRFLETLSLGRIPVVADTDVIFPLEETIDYSKIVVIVPMHDIQNTPRYIADFYNALSEEEWKARQELARDTFTKYLRQDAYFRHFFAVELPKLRATLAGI